ncbi:MAG: hypothetical protein GX660_06415, partial [Clostridiaceae bacterium]|nr:hypothetical protein [Clostridiaceae bacterium]
MRCLDIGRFIANIIDQYIAIVDPSTTLGAFRSRGTKKVVLDTKCNEATGKPEIARHWSRHGLDRRHACFQGRNCQIMRYNKKYR